MTSNVTIQALCSNENEVIVEIYDNDILVEEHVLQDKESDTYYIYDNRELITRERLKE